MVFEQLLGYFTFNSCTWQCNINTVHFSLWNIDCCAFKRITFTSFYCYDKQSWFSTVVDWSYCIVYALLNRQNSLKMNENVNYKSYFQPFQAFQLRTEGVNYVGEKVFVLYIFIIINGILWEKNKTSVFS